MQVDLGHKGGAALKSRFGITDTPFFAYIEGLDQNTQYQLAYDSSAPGEELAAWLLQQVGALRRLALVCRAHLCKTFAARLVQYTCSQLQQTFSYACRTMTASAQMHTCCLAASHTLVTRTSAPQQHASASQHAASEAAQALAATVAPAHLHHHTSHPGPYQMQPHAYRRARRQACQR